MAQPAPRRHRQPVAWAGMQGVRMSLPRPANDNRKPHSLRSALALLVLAALTGAGALLLLA